LFIVSAAKIQQYIYFCKGFGGKSLFIDLLGGGLLGDPGGYRLAHALLEGEPQPPSLLPQRRASSAALFL
jgi:hypothetical protein